MCVMILMCFDVSLFVLKLYLHIGNKVFCSFTHTVGLDSIRTIAISPILFRILMAVFNKNM